MKSHRVHSNDWHGRKRYNFCRFLHLDTQIFHSLESPALVAEIDPDISQGHLGRFVPHDRGNRLDRDLREPHETASRSPERVVAQELDSRLHLKRLQAVV